MKSKILLFSRAKRASFISCCRRACKTKYFRALSNRDLLYFFRFLVLSLFDRVNSNMEGNAQNASAQKQAMIYICGGKRVLFTL
jgi:hypothetical protein